MRKHRLLPIISVVLSLILLLHTVSPLVVSALDLISAENTQLLSESCQILDFVDEEVFQSGNHIARLPEEETLSSYAFLNSDGSKTIYYLNENVKYYDTSGSVREKNIALSASANGYNVTQNDVQLSIPTDLAQGLGISYAGYDISLIPQGGNHAAATQQSGNSVAYINYYGQNTALLYTPGYSGIKEDILLASYTGISSFSFLLNTDGLRLYSLNEKLFLSDAADSEMRIWLGDVVAYDFQGRPSKGTMSATAITEAQQYMLTIQIEEAFLTSESTVYPVVIDPTLTVSDATHGANAIEDAPIYSGYANTNHGSYIYDMVGYVDSNYGIGRTVIRPTGFLNSSVYQNIEFYQINSVIFYIKDATGSGSAQVNLHDLTGSLGWTESTVTWNNVGSYNSRPAATATVGNGSMAAFDITGLVRDWKGKTNDEDFGFVLIHANEASSSRSLIACEGSSSGSMPYIAMNYITMDSSASVREGATKALDTSDLSGTITWSIDSVNSSGYASVSSTGVVTGISAGTVIIKAYTGGTLAKTYTVYVTLRDGIYRIQNLNAGRYLGVRGGVFQNGSAVELQNTLVESPAKLQQYWHLTYLGDGCYNITPMFAGYKALYYSSYNSSTYLDSLGGSATQWAISSGDEGYLIHMAHDDSICLMASNGGTAAGTTVTAGALSDDTYPGEWDLERQTNMLGAILCDTDTGTYVSTNTVKPMQPDTTESAYSLGIQYHFYSSSSDPTCSEVWSSNNTAVAQVNSQTGVVTAVSAGTATIQVTVTDDETEYEFPLTYTLQVDPIIPTEYGIQNGYSNLYTKVKVGTDTVASAGDPLMQSNLTDKNLQIWQLSYVGSDYYYIALYDCIAGEPTTLYLGASGTSVLLYSAPSDATKWKVTETRTEGSRALFKLSPKSNEAYALALSSLSDTGEVDLGLKAYTNNTAYDDEWYMVRFLPTSGSEIDTTSETYSSNWSNSTVIYNVNCYGYAIDNQINLSPNQRASAAEAIAEAEEAGDYSYRYPYLAWYGQQPGAYTSNLPTFDASLLENVELLKEAVTSDFAAFAADTGREMIFDTIGEYEKCPEGTYKVALFLSPGNDYHWYRQDKDGFWSSKLPEQEVSYTDTVVKNDRTTYENLIINPLYAERYNPMAYIYYTTFIGFYAVTPWSLYYCGTTSTASVATEITVPANMHTQALDG